MYAETNIQAGKAKARRCKRRRSGNATRCFKQRGIQNLIQQCNKAPNRRGSTIQHIQQWGFVGVMAIHERKPWLEVCRYALQSKKRVVRARTFNPNRPRSATKQSKLVRSRMVGARRHHWNGDQSAKLAN